MKLKGISKLVLAGTALAVTAGTLTTATYAWYVTNTEVTATGVEASVAGSQIDGSLFIANNKYGASDSPYAYGTEITLNGGTELADNASPASQVHYVQTELNPQSKSKSVHYVKSKDTTVDSSKTYYSDTAGTEVADPTGNPKTSNYYEKVDANVWVDSQGYELSAANTRVLTFKMWLKASQDAVVNPTLIVDNTSSSLVKQTALSATGLPSNVSQGDSFAVDAIYALRMKVSKKCLQDTYHADTDVTASNFADKKADLFFKNDSGQYVSAADTTFGNSTTYYTKTAAGTVEQIAVYQVDKIAKDPTGGNYSTTNTTAVLTNGLAFTPVTSSDANKYYYSILGESYGAPYNTTAADGTSDDTASASNATTFASINIQGDIDTELIYEIWLEGSDAQCFDSCRGQSFTFDFKYEL